VVVHRLIGTVVAHADGIEVTGNGLVEVGLAFAEGFLDGTIAAPLVIVAGEDAILVVDNGRHQVALTIGIYHPLTVDDGPRFGAEVVPYHGEHFFELLHLVQLDRRSGISLDATLALAGRQVAQKLLAQHVETYHYIVYLYHKLPFFYQRLSSQSGVHINRYESNIYQFILV